MQEDDAMFLCKKQTACGVCEAILKYNTEPSLLGGSVYAGVAKALCFTI
jgi:hypothetical protein